MLVYKELARPLEGENPAGEDLSYDPRYLEMDTLAAGTPGSQIGNSSIEGHAADWKKLKERCLALWEKTRDLRIAVYLVVAETAGGMLADCADALKLLLFLIRDMWEPVYPRLDPEDDNDPTERLNIMAMLSPEPGAFNDPVMFLSKFRAMLLSPPLPYTLRDHLISIDELETVDGKTIDPNLITAEMMGIPLTEIEKQAAAARDIQETIKAICAAANEKLSDGYSLGMLSLSVEVDRLCKFYTGYMESYGGGTATAEPSEAENGDSPDSAEVPVQRGNIKIASYKPENRAEALLLLRKASEYFQREEPNSPIPLLVNRALRLSEMNFIELIEDIVPDALPRGKEILGVKEG
ncbi:MAG: type VI secretion system ImpA family N-terminal domain-containing protein [Spirochaetaceae bacterium]|nr:type VI secretion system ImpA family N-terminal domain-containing protein [Spirochaetaceae bacterium]